MSIISLRITLSITSLPHLLDFFSKKPFLRMNLSILFEPLVLFNVICSMPYSKVNLNTNLNSLIREFIILITWLLCLSVKVIFCLITISKIS